MYRHPYSVLITRIKVRTCPHSFVWDISAFGRVLCIVCFGPRAQRAKAGAFAGSLRARLTLPPRPLVGRTIRARRPPVAARQHRWVLPRCRLQPPAASPTPQAAASPPPVARRRRSRGDGSAYSGTRVASAPAAQEGRRAGSAPCRLSVATFGESSLVAARRCHALHGARPLVPRRRWLVQPRRAAGAQRLPRPWQPLEQRRRWRKKRRSSSEQGLQARK